MNLLGQQANGARAEQQSADLHKRKLVAEKSPFDHSENCHIGQYQYS